MNSTLDYTEKVQKMASRKECFRIIVVKDMFTSRHFLDEISNLPFRVASPLGLLISIDHKPYNQYHVQQRPNVAIKTHKTIQKRRESDRRELTEWDINLFGLSAPASPRYDCQNRGNKCRL